MVIHRTTAVIRLSSVLGLPDSTISTPGASHPPRLKMFHDVTPNRVHSQQMPAPDESTNTKCKHCKPHAQLTTYSVYVRSIPLWNSLIQEAAVTASTESHKDVASCCVQPSLCVTAADDVSPQRWTTILTLF